MGGFARGSRARSEDRRVRRSDFQGCAGTSKLAFRTEGGGGSHILGEAIGDSRSAESAGYLHFKPGSSDRFADASQAVIGVGNFMSESGQEKVWKDGRISGGNLN